MGKNQYDNLQKAKNSLEAVKKELEKESLNKERGLPPQKDFYPIYDIIENMYRTYGMEQPKFLAEMSLNDLLDVYSKLDKYIKTKEADLKDKYTSAITTRLITDDFKPNVNERILKAVEQSLKETTKAEIKPTDVAKEEGSGVVGEVEVPKTLSELKLSDETTQTLENKLKELELERTNKLIENKGRGRFDDRLKDEIDEVKRKIYQRENELASRRNSDLESKIKDGSLLKLIAKNKITAEDARGLIIESGMEVPSEIQSIVDKNKQDKKENKQSIIERDTDFLGNEKEAYMVNNDKANGIRTQEDIEYFKSNVKRAIDNGKYQKAIADGKMTANDAKIIIESYGLKVPKDILEQSIKETTKAETPTTTQESNVPVSETKEAQPIEPTKVEEKKTVSNSLRDKAKQVREQGVNKAFNLPEAKLPDGTQQAGFGGKGLNEAIAKSLEIVADAIDAGKEFLDAAKEGFENIKAYYKENAKSFDEKILRDKFIDNIAESKEQAEQLKNSWDGKRITEEPKIDTEKLDTLANPVIKSGKFGEYLSGKTIKKETGESPENNQTMEAQELMIGLNQGEAFMEEARKLFGENYAEKTLEYIQKSTANVENKALMYISLENALGRDKIANPENAAEITKQQSMVYEKSQKYFSQVSLALNYAKLRRIARVGYDVSKVTKDLFSDKEVKDMKVIEEKIQANADEINDMAEKVENGTFDIETDVPKIDNTTKEKNANLVKKVKSKLKDKKYYSKQVDFTKAVENGIDKIEQLHKEGMPIEDAVDNGIESIKKEFEKQGETFKANEFKNDFLQEYKQAKLDKQKEDVSVLDRAKQRVNENIEKIRAEILAKERELNKEGEKLNPDQELQRLYEVEKSLSDLRDKYLPKEKDPYEAEKQREAIKDKLVNDIIVLNEQINAKERNKKEAGVDVSNDAEINTLKKIKEQKNELLNEIDPKAKPKEKTQEDRLASAKEKINKSIEDVRQEILSKERKLKAEKLPADQELQRLRETKKQLESLRDKYMPQIDPYKDAKTRERVKNNLNKEIQELNKQINNKQKETFEKQEDKYKNDSEVKQLKDLKKAKQDVLEIIDPTPKTYVKNALIEQGFGREVNIKGQTKMILDWKKLAGKSGSVAEISKNVAKILEKDGFTQDQLDRMADGFIEEYVNLRTRVIENGIAIINGRNKKISTEQKTAAKKLAELYAFGLFDQDPIAFQVAINKALGVGVSEKGFMAAARLAQGLETLYTQTFNGVKFNDLYAKQAIANIENQMRQLLVQENSLQSNTKFKLANTVTNYLDISQTMILVNLKQTVENPLSGLEQLALEKIDNIVKGVDTKQLASQRRAMMATIFKDMVFNGGISFGKSESAFVNRQRLDDYVNSLSEKKLYHAIASVATGRATLNAMDAMYKKSITEIKFAQNLIKILTDKTRKDKMTKEDAIKFVSEKLTGQTYKDAQITAKEVIEKVNKDAGSEIIPQNQLSIDLLANDIVKSALEMGGKISTNEIMASYNAAYRAAGEGLGHEANNFISKAVSTQSAEMESKLNLAIKNKDWDRAASLRAWTAVYRNVLNPFVGGGTNWIVLKVEKMGFGLVTGLGYDFATRNKRKLDFSSETDVAQLTDALYNQSRVKDKYIRGVVGGTASLLMLAAYNIFDDDDEYRKWRGENMWAARYLDVPTSEYVLLQMAMENKKWGKYANNFINKNDAFSASTKIISAIDYGIKGQQGKMWGAIGEAVGSKLNTPLPWRLVKDGVVLYQGVTGQDPYHGNYKASNGFLNGVFQGGVIEWLGGRPNANSSSSNDSNKRGTKRGTNRGTQRGTRRG